MADYIVYKHTTPSNKVYIGITCKSPSQRWQNGKGYKKSPIFYRAIEKYGWNNIKHEILFDGLTKEVACQKEIELITKYHSNDPKHGYNLSSGGESGNAGVIASAETRKKMSVAHKGNLSNTGKKASAETRLKQSAARKGNKNNLGHKASAETRKKMSEAQTGAKNHFYGKTHSQETRGKLSVIALQRGMNDGNNPKAKQVCQYTQDGQLVKVWDCVKNASAFLGISYSYLIKIMKTQKPYKGFNWAYKGVV